VQKRLSQRRLNYIQETINGFVKYGVLNGKLTLLTRDGYPIPEKLVNEARNASKENIDLAQ